MCVCAGCTCSALLLLCAGQVEEANTKQSNVQPVSRQTFVLICWPLRFPLRFPVALPGVSQNARPIFLSTLASFPTFSVFFLVFFSSAQAQPFSISPLGKPGLRKCGDEPRTMSRDYMKLRVLVYLSMGKRRTQRMALGF